MASGKFQSSLWSAAGIGYRRYIEVVWSSANNTNDNKSIINWTAYSRSPDTSTTKWVYAKHVIITFNGVPTSIIGGTATKLYKDGKIGSGSIAVSHDNNGTKSINVSITAQIRDYGTNNSNYTGSVRMTPNPVYTLSISQGTGSNITINRTTCAGTGATGNLSSGANKLYYGDRLQISFNPNSNYSINTHTVNNSIFPSGNTHTVSGNVTVVATATPLKSTIGATDANIGSTSLISVNRYNTSHTHTITYSFGALTGIIVTKSSNTPISWSIPESFYAQITNASSGTCTLTCETFNGNTSLGSSTCQLKITASPSLSNPAIDATVKDINETTIALTGDDSTLIRYKSKALCTINATPKNSATISSLSIGNSIISGTTNDGVTTATKTYSNVSDTSFVFTTTDSRGYSAKTTKTPTMISYINLTCNPILSRPSPTDSSIVMTFTGDFFRGSFGACSNALLLQYRYKESEGSYGSWQTVAPSNIIYGISSYRSNTAISLGEEFDYRNNYVFQVRATDGGTVNGTIYTLSSVTKTIPVRKGKPIFDWGEYDFNFNVPIVFDDKYKLIFTPGDTFTLTTSSFSACAYITSSAHDLIVQFPISKPICANSVNADGIIIARGVNGYINGTSWETADISLSGGAGYTVSYTITDTGIVITFTFDNTITNATNNTPVAVTVKNNVTFTFS